MAVWEQGCETISTWKPISEMFRHVFDHSLEGKEAGEQLLTILQGSCQVAEYALEFCTIMEGSGWNNTTLKAAFHHRLKPEMPLNWCVAMNPSLLTPDSSTLINLAIHLDLLLHSHHSLWTDGVLLSASDVAEPMQLGRMWVSKEDGEKRCRKHRCFCCEQPDHFIAQTRTWPAETWGKGGTAVPLEEEPLPIAPNLSSSRSELFTLGKVTYKLDLPCHSYTAPSVHVSHLKPLRPLSTFIFT